MRSLDFNELNTTLVYFELRAEEAHVNGYDGVVVLASLAIKGDGYSRS